jgi:hypothetical protein
MRIRTGPRPALEIVLLCRRNVQLLNSILQYFKILICSLSGRGASIARFKITGFFLKERAMETIKDLKVKLPSIHNWKTSDDDEIAKRRYRAKAESLRVQNLDLRFPIFSNFAVKSGSGLTYSVEIRSVARRRFSCNCVDIHSLMSFLDPSVLGPLFRFNRDFYNLDERGRPIGYSNLEQLHGRIKPFLLRRRKADVEAELPDRTDQRYFVPLSPAQEDSYAGHEKQVARLVAIAKSRPLDQTGIGQTAARISHDAYDL